MRQAKSLLVLIIGQLPSVAKIIPHFFDERSCLKLVLATLQRASQRWQRIRITELEQKQLLVLRHQLGLDPDTVPTKRSADEAA